MNTTNTARYAPRYLATVREVNHLGYTVRSVTATVADDLQADYFYDDGDRSVLLVDGEVVGEYDNGAGWLILSTALGYPTECDGPAYAITTSGGVWVGLRRGRAARGGRVSRCPTCDRPVDFDDALYCSEACELHSLGFGALKLRRDPSGFRHYLHGEPVRCGTTLELEGGRRVRYESPLATTPEGRDPPALLYVDVDNYHAVITADTTTRLRWPARG